MEFGYALFVSLFGRQTSISNRRQPKHIVGIHKSTNMYRLIDTVLLSSKNMFKLRDKNMISILCSLLLLIWTYDKLSRQYTVIEKTYQKTLDSLMLNTVS